MKATLKIYLVIWILVYFFGAIAPGSSLFSIESKIITIFLTTIYLFLSILAFLGLYYNKPLYFIKPLRKLDYNLTISFLAICSLVGILCFIYDKTIIQGIDYSQGLAKARYQFIDNAAEREGISSIFSVLGYFLGAYCFTGLYLLLVFWDKVKVKRRILFFCIFILGIFIISLLTGGRTSVILIVTIFFTSYIIRKGWGLKAWPFSKAFGKIIIIISLIVFIYLIFIFSQRADATNSLAEFYAEKMFDWMQVKTNERFSLINKLPDSFQSSFFFLSILWIYLVHSNWIFEGIIQLNDFSGQAVFVNYRNILSKFGIVDTPQEWIFSGRFITWVGGIYHDFGIGGLIVCAILHGGIMGYSLKMILHNKGSFDPLNFLFFFLTFSISITSPFIIVIDVLMFPSILVSFVMFAIFMYIKSKIKFKI